MVSLKCERNKKSIYNTLQSKNERKKCGYKRSK